MADPPEPDNIDMADCDLLLGALRLDNVRRVIREESAEELAAQLAAYQDAQWAA